jgi:hypothetical protein
MLQADAKYASAEQQICEDICGLFDQSDFAIPNNIQNLVSLLQSFRAAIDLEVNNCAIKRSLSVSIKASRSRLIFGIPNVLKRTSKNLIKSLFCI